MNYFKTRMVSVMLAFGIFFVYSCTISEQTTQSRSETDSPISDLQAQLESIEDDLRNSPENSELLVEKAVILAAIAKRTSPPSQRENYYRNIKDIADQGISDQQEIERLDEVIRSSWSLEQGEGVKLLQLDNSGSDTELMDEITAHFQNAITVNPDSLVTYNLLANTQYRSGNYDKAIQTLNDALSVHGDNQPEVREKLAYLYLESGDIETAISHYEDLTREYRNLPEIRHGLANAYMLNNDHESAIAVLNELIEEYPNRIEYKESLASELYFTFRQKVTSSINSEEEVTAEKAESLISHLEEIDELYETIAETVPLSDENAFRKAAYMNNSSQLLNELSERLTNSEDAQRQLQQKRTEYLEQSLELWERLTENNPDNINYIRSLYDVYLQLDMEEEAESLKRSYNL